MAGFVVCPACGTHIKSGRRYCLRCLAVLPDAAATPLLESASIRMSGAARIGIAVAAAGIVAVVAFSRSKQPTTVDNARASVPTAASPRPTAAAAPIAAAPAESDAADGIEFLASKAGDDAPGARDLDAARGALERSLEKQPDDPATLNALGQVLARLNRPDEAMTRFEGAIAKAPDNAAFRFNWAYVASSHKRWTQAIEGYGAAARLAPTDYITQFNFALALHRRGDRGDAVREFRKAAAMAPGEAAVHVALATALVTAGQLAEAAQEYQRFLEIEPHSPAADAVRERLEALSSGQPARRPQGT